MKFLRTLFLSMKGTFRLEALYVNSERTICRLQPQYTRYLLKTSLRTTVCKQYEVDFQAPIGVLQPLVRGTSESNLSKFYLQSVQDQKYPK